MTPTKFLVRVEVLLDFKPSKLILDQIVSDLVNGTLNIKKDDVKVSYQPRTNWSESFEILRNYF